MTHPLDTFPLDFSLPEVQRMRTALILAFDNSDSLGWLLKCSGISPTSINLSQAMDHAWTDALDIARRQDKLRVLLSTAANEPNATAIRPVLDSLIAGTVTSPAGLPTGHSGGQDPTSSGHGEFAAEITRAIERESTLLDTSTLRRGLEVAASVCKLVVSHDEIRYNGNAFHIGGGILLTNHYVLVEDSVPATAVEAWFGYERLPSGSPAVHMVVPCDPSSIIGDPGHDWAIVRASVDLPEDAQPLSLAGPRPRIFDPVRLIDHADGGPKRIGLVRNVVIGLTDDAVIYCTDSTQLAPGSAGAPVLDSEWRVVGLHQQHAPASPDGRIPPAKRARRIEPIVAGLVAAGIGTPWTG